MYGREKVKNENSKGSRKTQKWLIFLNIVLVFVACSSSIYLFTKYEKTPSSEIFEFEKNVNAITEIDYSDQQEELNKLIEEGMMNINYSPVAVFNGKISESFNVKNIKNNNYPISFSIYDENGEKIYQSKQIDLGYEINSIELDKELSKGTHKGSIKIGYAKEGNVSSRMPLTIEVK